MFQDLDLTIEAMLNDRIAPTELRAADVSFETPDKGFGPGLRLATLNLFLTEIRENRELRDPTPIIEKIGDVYVQRRPPLRVDCEYVVTAWADPSSNQKIQNEHELLGQTLSWLSRIPIIPAKYFQGSLVGQQFPPPTLVAQMNGLESVGEFWSALGIPPRPHFNLIVTISMDLNQQVEGSLVTTTITGYRQGKDESSREELINIGGTVLDQNQNPVADAWVRLEPSGQVQITDSSGRFIFSAVSRGSNCTLHAGAAGLGEVTPRDLEIPSLSGEYNLQY